MVDEIHKNNGIDKLKNDIADEDVPLDELESSSGYILPLFVYSPLDNIYEAEH